MKNRFRIRSVVVLCVVLSACGQVEHEDVKAWMNESAKDLRGRVPPLPEIKPFPVVAYDAINLVPPFAPARIEPDKRAATSSGLGPRPDLNRRREPLEAYPLESLKMVGSLLQGKVKQAVVQADKAIYQVKAGNYMGQNFGVITSVTETEITLKELVEDSNGDWSERTSKMLLQEKPQEAKR